MITLTRIFLLTHDHQSLVREITTPALAGFIASCINLAQGTEIPSALQLIILQGLCELIGLHSTLFRPFLGQLQQLTLLLIAYTPSEASLENHVNPVSTPVADSARRLFVLLHVCSPKNTAGDEWTHSFESTLITAQRTADRVFRAIVEDRKVSPGMTVAENMDVFHAMIDDHGLGTLNLPSWTGIYAGIERLDGLLRTLQAFIATKTSVSVVLPVSSMMELVYRVLSACRPTKDSRIRPEVGRDERDGFATGLPQLHLSAMDLLSAIFLRMGSTSAALVHPALEHIFWVLDDENDVDEIRLAAYRILAYVLTIFGPSIPNSLAKSIARCLVLACEDIMPLQENLAQGGEASIMNEKQSGHESSTINADSYLKRKTTQRAVSSAPSVVQAAARGLIPLALARLPDGFLSEVVRIQIDSTSIVMNYREAMLASVLRTGTNKQGQRTNSSILPLLARAHPGDLGVEALLRPQLPLLQSQRTEQGVLTDEDEGIYGHQHRPEGNPSGVDHHDFGFSSIDHTPKTPMEPKDEIMQASGSQEHEVVAPPIKVASVIQLAPRRLLDSEAATSYNPSKRTWQDDATSDPIGGSDISTRGSTKPTEMGTPGKRARLTRDHLEHVLGPQQGSAAAMSTASPAVGSRISEDAIPNSSISEAVGATGAQFDLQQRSDDESDFEMPTLHLGPDSDEEDDEEEYGEEEEEEDDGV